MIRISGRHVFQDVEPASIRHVDVHQQQVPFFGPQSVKRLGAAGDLADIRNGRICLEKLLISGSDDRVIVSNENS
jgi:hypothetical protein